MIESFIGILFPNGKQLLSLFHDSDFKWSGAPTQVISNSL